MASHIIDSGVLGDLFGTAEMRAIFSDDNLLQKYLDVEAALARQEAELGLIPREAAEEIDRKAQVANLDKASLKRQVDLTWHPIVPLIRELQKACDGDAGEYIHWGATTQDIMDTGMVLQLRDTWAVVYRDLRCIEEILLGLAVRHRDTLVAGRTHGQHALPVTFGLKVAVWVREVRRHIERWVALRPRVLVGQLAGAAGTLAGFGPKGFELQERVMADLGLGVPDVVWHAARDRVAEWVFHLCLISATLSKMAREVVNLQRTEIGELEEPFTPGKVGSSTMPQKRNPMICETVQALDKIIRRHVSLALEGMVAEHERDMAPWATEWEAVPESAILAAAALNHMKYVLGALVVRPDRMRKNLDLQGGLILSEAVMLRLGRNMGRQQAHEVVYEAAMRAFEEGVSFDCVLMEDARVAEVLSQQELEELLNPESYTGLAAETVDRVVARTRAEREADPRA